VLTQSQLEDILRHACTETVCTSTSPPPGDVVRSGRPVLGHGVIRAAGVDNAVVVADGSGRSGLGDVSGRGQATKASVRWRSISPGARSEDKFFDAAQSPLASRSTSRVRYPHDGDQKSSPTEDVGQRAAAANPKSVGGRSKDAKPVDTGQGGRRRPSPPLSAMRPSTSTALSKWMKPDKFNDSVFAETFLAHFNICGDSNGWSDSDRSAQLRCSCVASSVLQASSSGTAAAQSNCRITNYGRSCVVALGRKTSRRSFRRNFVHVVDVVARLW